MGLGTDLAPANAVKQGSEMDGVMSSFDANLAHLGRLLEHSIALSDGLLGSVPRSATEDEPDAREGRIGSLRYRCDRMKAALNQLEEELQRIASAV